MGAWKLDAPEIARRVDVVRKAGATGVVLFSHHSLRDIAVLREVQRLSQEEGVNLAGIKRILELEAEVDALRTQIGRLVDQLRAASYGPGDGPFERRYLPVPAAAPSPAALVIWRSTRR